jgi:DivIVA domain-containing protein
MDPRGAACRMAAVELDRQSIEKRDFPIGRRGYDPAAVDAHLRALAAEVEELRYSLESRAGETLGSSAGTQVQGILEAAEATAADIEQKAAEDARETRTQADNDAAATRADAVQRAQAHVAAVAQATATLIERVESMDGEAVTLVASLRAGASRLATDLDAVETNMAELYDAASGRGAGPSQGEARQQDSQPASSPAPVTDDPAVSRMPGDSGSQVPVRQGHAEFIPAAAPTPTPTPEPATLTPPPAAAPIPPPLPFPAPPASTPTAPRSNEASGSSEDLDGARLIALNMALNGESRLATDRYLAENYELADRHKLLDEVYAAVEG